MTRIISTAFVAIHLAAVLWHGSAHTRLDIHLPIEKNLFIYAVILLAPIVAAALIWSRYRSLGLWIFFLSMLAAFLFGAYHHYVLVSPDNIHHLPAASPESQSQFKISAGAIAMLELAAAFFGAYNLGRQGAPSRP